MTTTTSRVICNEKELYYQVENERYPIEVREASNTDDFESIVRLNRSTFPHDNETDDYARQWIQHNWKHPYYVIKYNQSNIVGYILWGVRGGYKRHIACELEQIAIDLQHHRQGFGSYLLKISLLKFQHLLQTRLHYAALKIGIIHLTTGCNNDKGQDFYSKILHTKQRGGKLGAIYGSNEYGEEEIMMVNENVEPLMDSFTETYKFLEL